MAREAEVRASTLHGVATGECQITNPLNRRFGITMSSLEIQPAIRAGLANYVKQGAFQHDVIITLAGKTADDHAWLKANVLKQHLQPRFPKKTIQSEGIADECSYRIKNCTVAEATRTLTSKQDIPDFIDPSGQIMCEKLNAAAECVQRHYDTAVSAAQNGRQVQQATGWFEYLNTPQWEARIREIPTRPDASASRRF